MKGMSGLFRAYTSDWLTAVFCLALTGGLHFIQPFQRYFFPDDQAIAYPLQPETIPTYALGLLAVLTPLILIVLIWRSTRGSQVDLHHAILGFALAISITLLITEILKISVGRLRPNFLARCQPTASNIPNPACGSEDNSSIQEGRKSFPSGHSSIAFAGLAYLSLYIAGKLKLFDGNGKAYKLIVIGVPLIGATLIAISRVNDYFHHWQDVTVGGLLGLFMAYLAYRHYYPNLRSEQGGVPKEFRLELLPLASPTGGSNNSVSSGTNEPLQVLISTTAQRQQQQQQQRQ